MEEYVKVATTGDISNGTIRTFVVKGKSIAIARIGDDYFAIDDTCSHAQCSLGSEGFMNGGEIICGCHGSRFDLKTGKVRNLPATIDVGTYRVKITGDDILVAC